MHSDNPWNKSLLGVSKKESWTEFCCFFFHICFLMIIDSVHLLLILSFGNAPMLHWEGKVESRLSTWVLMNLCHLCCCFRWRHGWLIPIWTCSPKPTPRRVPLGFHLLRYRRFDLIGTLSGFFRWGGIFFLERVNWRLIITMQWSEEPVSIFLHWQSTSQLSLGAYSLIWLITNGKLYTLSVLPHMVLSYWFGFSLISSLVYQLNSPTFSSEVTACYLFTGFYHHGITNQWRSY